MNRFGGRVARERDQLLGALFAHLAARDTAGIRRAVAGACRNGRKRAMPTCHYGAFICVAQGFSPAITAALKGRATSEN